MNYKVGDFVQFISEEMHNSYSIYYPVVGTVGEVVATDDIKSKIQWPVGTTIGRSLWWSRNDWIKPVAKEDEDDEAIEEIDITSLLS